MGFADGQLDSGRVHLNGIFSTLLLSLIASTGERYHPRGKNCGAWRNLRQGTPIFGNNIFSLEWKEVKKGQKGKNFLEDSFK